MTFFIVSLAWVFFRAENVSQAVAYISGIFSAGFFSMPEVFPMKVIYLLLLFILAEWLQRNKQHALQFVEMKHPVIFRWGLYYGVVLMVLLYGGDQQEFIYFQF